MTAAKLALVHPVFMFGAVVLAFGGWVFYEGVNPTISDVCRAASVEEDDVPTAAPAEAVLHILRPGMPREIVEQQLMALASGIDPATFSSGEEHTQSSYQIRLSHPVPHLMTMHQMRDFRPGAFVLTVWFDGRLPTKPVSHIELTACDAQ